MSYTLHVGDCMAILPTLPKGSVQCCVTSPPYFGLRDYGQDGQLGLESTPDEYVAKLVAVFREVRRVLRDDGTVWLNLGDSYGGGHGDMPKQLLGIPWRVAFALQADGWYLRQDIIWHKTNPMPESVTDRCTKAHEYMFLLTKSARYYYDAEAVREGAQVYTRKAGGYHGDVGTKPNGGGYRNKGGIADKDTTTIGRNRRSVWTVSTQPYGGAHFATFPPKLIEPCILAGTPEKGCCPHCGAPWERVVKRESNPRRKRGIYPSDWRFNTKGPDAQGAGSGSGALTPTVTTTGHSPTCSCPEHEPVPSTVLDPFGGSGTTAGVAIEHGRKAILCELSEEYAKFIPDRINSITDALTQGRMF